MAINLNDMEPERRRLIITKSVLTLSDRDIETQGRRLFIDQNQLGYVFDMIRDCLGDPDMIMEDDVISWFNEQLLSLSDAAALTRPSHKSPAGKGRSATTPKTGSHTTAASEIDHYYAQIVDTECAKWTLRLEELEE